MGVCHATDVKGSLEENLERGLEGGQPGLAFGRLRRPRV